MKIYFKYKLTVDISLNACGNLLFKYVLIIECRQIHRLVRAWSKSAIKSLAFSIPTLKQVSQSLVQVSNQIFGVFNTNTETKTSAQSYPDRREQQGTPRSQT